jgi:hypothetical protein
MTVRGRFIETCLREWAYAQAYHHSRQRTGELPIWLHRYNWHRPHTGIGAKTPISRLGLVEDNLLRLHIWAINPVFGRDGIFFQPSGFCYGGDTRPANRFMKGVLSVAFASSLFHEIQHEGS